MEASLRSLFKWKKTCFDTCETCGSALPSPSTIDFTESTHDVCITSLAFENRQCFQLSWTRGWTLWGFACLACPLKTSPEAKGEEKIVWLIEQLEPKQCLCLLLLWGITALIFIISVVTEGESGFSGALSLYHSLPVAACSFLLFTTPEASGQCKHVPFVLNYF